MRNLRTCVGGAAVGALAVLFGDGSALGQFAPIRLVVTDRDNDRLWVMWDMNGNGVIDEPGELIPFFNASNAQGTLTVLNPNTIGVRPDGLVIVGDQDNARRCAYRMRDLNGDGDAQDAFESVIGADPTNLSGYSLAFPVGVAFDSVGRGYMCNAGNGFGLDRVFRLEDLSYDGTWQQGAEIKEYVGAPVFGATNGPSSPQEICFVGQVMYLRDSGSGFQGVWKAVDGDDDGRADGPGEYTAFWTAAGSSGVTPGAGFALCVDPMHPRSFYTLQTVSPPAGTDQLIRISDNNNDGDAQDSGEAVVVFQTSEAGFTAVDVIALPDGRVLVSDNSGNRIIVLTDTDNDGLFNSTGERANFFANTGGQLASCRAFDLYPVICPADLAQEGNSEELAGPDGFITGIDMEVFVMTYYKETRRHCDASLPADVTDGVGTGGPDGFITGTDADRYVERFFMGC